MRRRNVTALLLVCALTVTALAGCGTAQKEEEQKTEDNGKKVITIWTKTRHDLNYVQEKIDEYNKTNTENVVVEYEVYTDNYEQAIDLAIQSGELPDILSLNDQVYNKYVGQGQ